MAAESILKVEEVPGRGRALVATRALMAGQEVLRESPILVYSALPLVKHQHHNSSDYCNHCFRIISSQSAVSCPTCSSHHFCNQTCLSAAHLLSHSPLVCQSLCRLRDYLSMQSLERQIQARFLIAAYNLALVSPSDFQLLISLQGCVSDCTADESQFLHTLVSSSCPIQIPGLSLSVELTASLLAKDKLNAFGLMEHPHNLLHKNGRRSVRAYAIYPTASLFNHDCLPNACRFDYVDSAPNNNTEIVVRMIHDVPQGREICLSYFPVNLNYCSRQKRLSEDYGFSCDCDRCKVEVNWSDNEDGNEADADIVDVMEEGDEDMDEELEQDLDVEFENENSAADFPHAYFFARFMCNIENCGGTLAPLPLGSRVSDALECNACGDIKKDEVINGTP